MDFTFGICSTEANSMFHQKIVDSIKSQNIPNYEIVFVGEDCYIDNVNFIYFDEVINPGWITKKKNLITNFAQYENIVYMHDYIELKEDWYSGFLKNPDFKISMTRVLNLDGKRNIDWLVYYQDLCLPNAEQLLPYDVEFSKIMYIPGFYWVAKKDVMQEFPLNESILWGQAEDVDWSRRVREKYKFSMNADSTVQFLKQKEYTLNVMSDEKVKEVKKFYESYS